MCVTIYSKFQLLMCVTKFWATSLQDMAHSLNSISVIDHRLVKCYVITPCVEVMTVIHVHS